MGQYIENLAKSLMGQLGIEDLDIGEGNHGPWLLWDRWSPRIKQELSKMKPETLGKIAAQGRGDGEAPIAGTKMYNVHCGTWLSKRASGKDLLLDIACTAIVAEMADILEFRREAKRSGVRLRSGGVPHASEYQSPEDVPDRVMHRSGFVG